MKKIISLFTPGHFGGAERVVAIGLSALHLSDPNHELWLIHEIRIPHLVDEFRKYLPSSLKIRVFQTTKVVDVKLINSLKEALKEVSLIHAHGYKAVSYAFLAKNQQKLIATHHGATAHSLKVRIYEQIERWVMRRSQAVVAVSNIMKLELSKNGIEENSIHVIENPLSIKLRPLEVSGSTTHFLYVGRLSPEKGVVELVLALNGLGDRDWKLTIVGDGQERERIERTIAPELRSRFIFSGFQKDVSSYLTKSHTLVIPSHREGLPMVMIEAICLGLPVVGSRVGALPDFISKNGILVAPKSSSELAEGLCNFMDNADEYIAEAMRQKEGFVIRFSVTNWVERTTALYFRVLNQA